MRFGFMMPFQNPPRWARPYPDLYREHIQTRITDLALGMHLPGLAPEKVRQAMTIFAREVMPRFK